MYRYTRPENTTTTIIGEEIAPTIVDASDSELEEEAIIEDLRKYIPLRSARVRSIRRPARISSKDLQ